MGLLDFCLWVAPGIGALGLALAGEVWETSADLALLYLMVLFWWLLLLRIFRRRAGGPRRVGFALAWSAAIVVGHLLWGVPRWLRSREDAAIAAVEGWKAKHGAYPDAETSGLRAQLGPTGCFYAAKGASYQLICSQNMIRRCEYDRASGAWSCGEP